MATTLEKAQVLRRVLIEDAFVALDELRRRVDRSLEAFGDTESDPEEQVSRGERIYRRCQKLLKNFNQAARLLPGGAEFRRWEPRAEQLGRLRGPG